MSHTTGKNSLFAEFPAITSQEWKAQILRDLKAATDVEKEALYEQQMMWHTYEGIPVQPFYTLEDMQTLEIPHSVTRATAQWQNRDEIKVEDEKEANLLATEALRKGADAVLLDLSGIALPDINLARLLHNIKLTDTPVSFKINQEPQPLLTALKELFPYQWKGSLAYDPIAHAMTTGILPDTSFEALATCLKATLSYPHFYTLTVSGHHFHQAGASAVQELAFVLATFVEYADQLTNHGIAIADVF